MLNFVGKYADRNTCVMCAHAHKPSLSAVEKAAINF